MGRLEPAGNGSHRSPGRAALRLGDHRIRRHLAVQQVVPGDHRFAHRVSPTDTPGHHQPWGKTFPVQLQRVIQPGPKDWRWPSVVLRGAEYHNSVRWMPLILLTYHEDHHQ